MDIGVYLNQIDEKNTNSNQYVFMRRFKSMTLKNTTGEVIEGESNISLFHKWEKSYFEIDLEKHIVWQSMIIEKCMQRQIRAQTILHAMQSSSF